jgi:hypothetical protein
VEVVFLFTAGDLVIGSLLPHPRRSRSPQPWRCSPPGSQGWPSPAGGADSTAPCSPGAPSTRLGRGLALAYPAPRVVKLS